MTAEANPSERTLEFSPTWALATVASVFVVISFLVERLLHWLGHFLTKTKRKALFAAFMKIKDELMLVGFISLAMAMLATPVSKICIRSALYDKWTPCHISERPGHTVEPGAAANATVENEHRRRLLAEEGIAGCPAGKEPFISADGLHQLHIFVFILAAVHVVYSCLTMLLALAKVHSWRKWEREAQEAAHGVNLQDIANSITLTRKSTFQRYHTSVCCSSNTIVVWVICFFQQMYIPRADYITLRQAFTTNHHLRDDYDFDAYMIRCMEDEFHMIVGISAKLWAFVILFLLFNVNGVYLYFWSSFIPIILVLVIGAKLQYVVAALALEAVDVPGAFVPQMLKPRNELFWFGRPELVLSILHLVLFQNAFELATFFWYLWTFGWNSCLLEVNKTTVYARLSMGLAVQLFCSVSTLPLYTLVSQMGTNLKQSVLPPTVGKALRTWHKDARKRVKIGTMFSFGNKRNRSAIEEESLKPKDLDSGSSSLSPPMGIIMEENSTEREDGVQPSARTPGTSKTTKSLHNVYVQLDANEKKGNA